jgi:micrococcal nuclease
MWEYNAEVARVVDGDTLDLRVDLGFTVFVKVRARLHGINTPETYGVKKDSEEYAAGMKAKEYVEDWLMGFPAEGEANSYLPVKIRSHDGRALGTGKYGRWIVEVFRRDDDPDTEARCLNEELVEQGLAEEVAY